MCVYAIIKTMCPPSYHYNDFMATHALGHMVYGYTLLAPMNKECSSKERNISGHKCSTTHNFCMRQKGIISGYPVDSS